jgi:hypothetical protein
MMICASAGRPVAFREALLPDRFVQQHCDFVDSEWCPDDAGLMPRLV